MKLDLDKKGLKKEVSRLRRETGYMGVQYVEIREVLHLIDQLGDPRVSNKTLNDLLEANKSLTKRVKELEPEKVVIPQFVADWISKAKKWEYSISDSMGHVTFYDDTTQYDKAMRWANKNQDIFARAWLDSYEIEKEKLYSVIIPTKCEGWKYHYLDAFGGIDATDNLKNVECHTEDFIRSISDDLWQFAEPVEEEEK